MAQPSFEAVRKCINEIEDWIKEVSADQDISGDEVAWDVISSYISSQVSGGEKSPMAKEIRRMMLGA